MKYRATAADRQRRETLHLPECACQSQSVCCCVLVGERDEPQEFIYCFKMFICERERQKSRERRTKRCSQPTVEMRVSVLCACLCVWGGGGSRTEWELGSAALLSVPGLSEKEFEVEDLRSPLRPHPCSQISC